MLSCGSTIRQKGRDPLVSTGFVDGGTWIAIASYDPRFLRLCQKCLDKAVFRCTVYQSGEDLLYDLQNGFYYQAILLDNALLDMDTAEFCRRLREPPMLCQPWLVLVPTRNANSLYSLLRAGDTAQLELEMKHASTPDLSSLNSMLFDLKSILHAQELQADTDLLTQHLVRWGVQPGALGCGYLREAVHLALQSESHLAIRKGILLPIGERHNVTVGAVDSGIRRLIDLLNAQNTAAWQDFNRRRNPQGHKLTTRKFIYAVRDELLMPPQDAAQQPPSEGEPQADEREPQSV